MTEENTGGAAQAAAGNAEPTNERVFRIQRVYLKDVSFESPRTPSVFVNNATWKPEVQVHLNTDKEVLDNDLYEVTLVLTVTVKNEGETAYLTEVKQSGLFTIKGLDDASLNGMLYSFCPNILFPFGRQAIADIVMRGGFPQLLLDPVNFDALYAQHVESARQNAPAPGTSQ